MDIKTAWIGIVNYLASGLGAVVGGFLTHLFAGLFGADPIGAAAIGSAAALGLGYILHHYLDNLLTVHVATVTAAVNAGPANVTVNGAPLTPPKINLAVVTAGNLAPAS